MTDVIEINNQLVLVVGESGSGKSRSLKNIPNQKRWVYFNTETGKRLPFKNEFQQVVVTDAYQLLAFLQECVDNRDDIDGVIIDSLTFWFEMYVNQYVNGASDGRAAWGQYFQNFVSLRTLIAQFGKPTIILAHTKQEYDEVSKKWKSAVPCQGQLKSNGVEASFSVVIACKKETVKELEKYGSKMLDITDRERMLGFKHVYQTKLTASTTGERIRGPEDLFEDSETFIDNDAYKLLQHLSAYYGD